MRWGIELGNRMSATVTSHCWFCIAALVSVGLVATEQTSSCQQETPEDRCRDVLLYQVEWSKFDSLKQASFLKIITRDDWEKNEVKAKLKALTPTKPPIPFEGTYEKFQEWRKQYFEQISYSLNESQSLEYLRSFLSPEQVGAWADCMRNKFDVARNSQQGIHYNVARGSGTNSGLITITWWYNKIPTAHDPIRVTSATVANGQLVGDSKLSGFPSGLEIAQTWKVLNVHGDFLLEVNHELGTTRIEVPGLPTIFEEKSYAVESVQRKVAAGHWAKTAGHDAFLSTSNGSEFRFCAKLVGNIAQAPTINIEQGYFTEGNVPNTDGTRFDYPSEYGARVIPLEIPRPENARGVLLRYEPARHYGPANITLHAAVNQITLPQSDEHRKHVSLEAMNNLIDNFLFTIEQHHAPGQSSRNAVALTFDVPKLSFNAIYAEVGIPPAHPTAVAVVIDRGLHWGWYVPAGIGVIYLGRVLARRFQQRRG